MRSKLLLNVSPVYFANSPLEVEIFDYDSNLQLDELRARYYKTHVFKRDLSEKADRIICVPLSLESPTIGGETEVIYSHDNRWLCCTIIRNSLINFFASYKRTILDFLPILFVADGIKDELLSQSMPTGVTCPEWISIHPLFEIDVREFKLDHSPPFVGLTLDLKSTRQIGWNCSELINDGFDPRGLYVKRRMETRDPRIFPKSELIGRIDSFSKGILKLSDSRDGISEFPAEEAFIETRPDAWERCFSYAFGKLVPDIKFRLDTRLAELRRGPERLERLRRVLEYISKQNLEMAQGLTCTFGSFLEVRDSSELQFPTVLKAPGATYVFDPTGNRTSIWPVDNGLEKHGPYSQRDFITRPKVCVICQKSKKGQVEQFIRKLKEGITNSKSSSNPFEKGLLRKYHLEDLDTEFFVTEDNSAQAYKRAIRQALESGGPNGPRWNLALVQTEEKFHELYGGSNPYLISKAEFLSHQIPSQEFEIETANLNEYSLSYALNNISLAIYAKLGGTPWLIRADQGIAHELVIGIGSARIGDSRLGVGERVVGITTVFTGDGNYCVSNLTRAVAYRDYRDELLATLRIAVNQVRADINWRARDPVRLIFHAFKPLRDAETLAVKALMEEMGEYDVEYAFIHVVTDHPYLVFDENQGGILDKRTRKMKGVFGPTRGLFFRLSHDEVLLSLTGFREVKRPDDGIPFPVLLRLHRHSTFVDTTYLSRQVFTFASHSWQGFFPCDMPVSILYSGLIARQLGQLSTIPNWNSNAMLGRIGWTRWFL
ncbi:argonaute/piwi family protein (plasmid) [Tundrisphaera sp. TA3]|uniref:argonaute/piwi family protein n=1 Tax=Tundrisphaera sp. TA3 TaxID=3435775 RepID=UPI003EBAB9AE